MKFIADTSFVIIFALSAALGFVAVYARRKHESVKQAYRDLVKKLTLEGSKLEAGLLEKLHALENGGHLASGTTQMVIDSQTTSGSCPGGLSIPSPTMAK